MSATESDTASGRNVLENILDPVAAMINDRIAAKTPARELCEQLDGRVFALRVRDSGLAAYCIVHPGGVMLSADYPDEPDVVVTGSLLSLPGLAGDRAEELVRDGSIEFSGDALLARDFRKLLRYARPDFEESLSGVVGDAAAHGIGEFVRGVGAWARDARTTMRRNIGEYLQEESRSVPGRYEFDEFRGAVGKLRDDVDRLAARVDRILRERS